MLGLGAKILGPEEGVSMPSALTVAQSVAAPELSKETLGPNSSIQNVAVVDANDSELEKREDTISSF